MDDVYVEKVKAVATVLWDLSTKLHAEGIISIREDVAIKCILSDNETDKEDHARYNDVVNHWIDKSNKRKD